jgi:hypothetical protein
MCSPSIPMGCLLVARMARSGHCVSNRMAAAATPSSTCSQLSRTNRWRPDESTLEAPASESASATLAALTASAIDADNNRGSSSDASSATQRPAGNWYPCRRATSKERRVLPTPPVPTRVTIRSEETSSPNCLSSRCLPKNLDNASGRFVGCSRSTQLWSTTAGSRVNIGPLDARSAPTTSPRLSNTAVFEAVFARDEKEAEARSCELFDPLIS